MALLYGVSQSTVEAKTNVWSLGGHDKVQK